MINAAKERGMSMRMIVMGGGKTGHNLARSLLDKKYEVSVIEQDRIRCQRLADDLDVTVCRGDGTNVSVLESVGALEADCFMAVTGVDQDNLVACQLARDYFRAKKVIARVNDPRNVATFQMLGIENLVCSAELLTRMIEQEADQAHMHLIATLNQGKAGICSITLPPDSALDGMALRNVEFPSGALVISVIRDGELTIPNGSTVLQRGDELVAVAGERVQKALVKALSVTQKR